MRVRAVTRFRFVPTVLIFMMSIFFSTVWGQSEEKVELRYHTYRDNTGLKVISPSLSIEKGFTERTTLFLKYTRELFSLPPPPPSAALPPGGGGEEHQHKTLLAVDAVSGASVIAPGGVAASFEEIRREMAVRLLHRRDQTAVAGSYAYSNEDDYRSHVAGLALSRDFFINNTHLLADYTRAWDQVDNLNKQPGEKWPRDKNTQNGTVVLTQILSPKSFTRFGYALSDVEGYQASPYRRVTVKATSFDEVHPDTRLRHSLFVWYNRYFLTRTSGHVNGTLYRDDWGVNAYSTEVKLYQSLFNPLILRLRYRYYRQTAADFFREVYTQRESLMSADPKLRAFESRLYGAKLVLRVPLSPSHFFERVNAEVGYDRLIEPFGFRADIYQGALRLVF